MNENTFISTIWFLKRMQYHFLYYNIKFSILMNSFYGWSFFPTNYQGKRQKYTFGQNLFATRYFTAPKWAKIFSNASYEQYCFQFDAYETGPKRQSFKPFWNSFYKAIQNALQDVIYTITTHVN